MKKYSTLSLFILFCLFLLPVQAKTSLSDGFSDDGARIFDESDWYVGMEGAYDTGVHLKTTVEQNGHNVFSSQEEFDKPHIGATIGFLMDDLPLRFYGGALAGNSEDVKFRAFTFEITSKIKERAQFILGGDIFFDIWRTHIGVGPFVYYKSFQFSFKDQEKHQASTNKIGLGLNVYGNIAAYKGEDGDFVVELGFRKYLGKLKLEDRLEEEGFAPIIVNMEESSANQIYLSLQYKILNP